MHRPTGRAHGRLAIASRCLDAVVGLAAIAASTWLWWIIWQDTLAALWNDSLLGQALVALAATPTIAAIIIGALGLTRR